MKAKVIYSPSNDAKEAYEEIKRKIEDINFKPTFLFLFLTAGTWRAYKSFNELLKKRFPDTKMLGCIVEGYIADDEIWMRGVAVLLADFEGDVEVFWAKEKTATETIEKLGDMIGKGWDAVLVMFPAFYFPGKFGMLNFFLNDRKYYHSFVRNKNNEKGIKALEEYSKYLDKKKMLYPINTVLKVISQKTGRNTPIIGMDLMPLEAASHTPVILGNYKNVGNGMAAMCFRGEVNAIFHDIYPERKENFEETSKIIKNYFPECEELNVTKKGVAIGEVNGLRVVDLLKTKKEALQDVTQEEFLEKVEKGKQLVASPYGLAFISEKTHGCIFLGIINSPLMIYPSLFNTDMFYDTAIFAGEVFRGGIKSFGGVFKFKKCHNFDFLIIDWDTIMSFAGEVHKIVDLIKEGSNSCFAVFSCPPSAYIPNTSKKYMSEIEESVCVNLGGTSVLLEFE